MKNKVMIKLMCVCMMVVMVLSASGCQLSKEGGSSQEVESQDQFVGFFITTEKVDEKFYAEMTETEEHGIKYRKYEFKEYEGIPFCQVISSDDGGEKELEILKTDAVCDIHTATEAGTDKWSLEGNVYFSEDVGLYVNEVYQEDDGDVYVVPYDGIKHLISMGVTAMPCQTINEKTVLVNATVIGEPEKINFVYMGADNAIVTTEVYEPGKMPEEIEVPEGTEYVIVDTIFEEGYDPIREIYEGNDQLVKTFKLGDMVVLEQVQTSLKWE